jgi:predicted nucleic acid-binding protein
VGFVVLDTDVASHLFRGRVDETLTRHLVGSTLAITFVTVGVSPTTARTSRTSPTTKVCDCYLAESGTRRT